MPEDLKNQPASIRRPSRPAAGHDPPAEARHLRHSHRQGHRAVSFLPPSDAGNERRCRVGISRHRGAIDLHQIADAAYRRIPMRSGKKRKIHVPNSYAGCSNTSNSRTPPQMLHQREHDRECGMVEPRPGRDATNRSLSPNWQ